MTAGELEQGLLDAEYCIAEVRKHGGVVLRIPAEKGWRLYVHNGAGVPTELKFRLVELQPFVLVYLRRLVGRRFQVVQEQFPPRLP
jgi:hypothetical protein